jgi:hypothetical protein
MSSLPPEFQEANRRKFLQSIIGMRGYYVVRNPEILKLSGISISLAKRVVWQSHFISWGVIVLIFGLWIFNSTTPSTMHLLFAAVLGLGALYLLMYSSAWCLIRYYTNHSDHAA